MLAWGPVLAGALGERKIVMWAKSLTRVLTQGGVFAAANPVYSFGGRHGNSLQYSCLENPHGQRSLAGHSPWDHKELDTTQQLNNNSNNSVY